jgi:hypothetical protein
MKDHFPMNRLLIPALLLVAGTLYWTGTVHAQSQGLSEDLYKEIYQGCLNAMSKNIVEPNVSKAYCYCYTERLGEWMSEADFARMSEGGPTDRDHMFFDRARKQCKPAKQKRKSWFGNS